VARRSDAPVRRPTVGVRVITAGGTEPIERPDVLATEEPMEIRAHGPREQPVPVAVTLRTPGSDFELAAGFLYGEGILRTRDELDTIAYCLGADGEQEYNVVTVRTRRAVTDRIRPRMFTANSSCGLCGKTALDDLEVDIAPLGRGPRVPASVLQQVPELLAPAQPVFAATGGLHAAARIGAAGTVIALREDIGRHNALDKIIGGALLEGSLPLTDDVIACSGRLGFELVQKAAAAGATVIAAVGAPSSLAVDAARRFGMTIVGFVRSDRYNVYHGAERIDFDA
jgi:FdhD protein